MNAGRLAMGIGAAAVAGATLYGIRTAIDGADDRARAQEDAEWAAWRPKLEAAVPGGVLRTEDHRRRAAEFLAANPAPRWINATIPEAVNRVSIERNGKQRDGSVGGLVLMALSGMTGGAMALYSHMHMATPTLRTAAMGGAGTILLLGGIAAGVSLLQHSKAADFVPHGEWSVADL